MKKSFASRPPALSGFSQARLADLEKTYEKLFERIRSAETVLRCFAPEGFEEAAVEDRLRLLIRQYPEPSQRPPLFGVPVGVKEIFRVERARIRCGSLLPPDMFEGPEAACVTMLKNAGAVVMGLTATAEFAYFEPPATVNPHDIARTPGGSSSGSAAGVAAGFFPLALGTQTVGSVIRPAAYCGVTGFKPTQGRIPADGLVFFSRSADQVGFFCTEPSEVDSVMAAAFSEWLREEDPKRVRLGVPSGPYLNQAEDGALKSFHNVLEQLQEKSSAGGPEVEVVETPCLEDILEIAERHADLISAEVGREHEETGLFPRYEPLYRPRTAAMVRGGLEVPATRIQQSLSSMAELRGRLAGLMDEHGLNAMAAPAARGEAPEGIGSTGSPVMNMPWTHAGMPVISIPMGNGPAGLPLGLQLAGRPGRDEQLTAVARVLYSLISS